MDPSRSDRKPQGERFSLRVIGKSSSNRLWPWTNPETSAEEQILRSFSANSARFLLGFKDRALEASFVQAFFHDQQKRAWLMLWLCFLASPILAIYMAILDWAYPIMCLTFPFGGMLLSGSAMAFMTTSKYKSHAPVAVNWVTIWVGSGLCLLSNFSRILRREHDIDLLAPLLNIAALVVMQLKFPFAILFSVVNVLLTFVARLTYMSSLDSIIYSAPHFVTNIICLVAAYWLEKVERKRFFIQWNLHQVHGQLSTMARKSERILVNILPAHIIEAYRNNGAVNRLYENCTVIFVKLLSISTVSPDEMASVLTEMTRIVSRLETCCERCGVEKVKTVGSFFMAVAGAPKECTDHVQRGMRFALNAMASATKLGHKIQVGMHIGPVVGGIIGTKISWDIWGDAVNTSARMCSMSRPGLIHVSGAVREAYLAAAATIEAENISFVPRGSRLDVKGKGIMLTFYVHGARGAFGEVNRVPKSPSKARIPSSGSFEEVDCISTAPCSLANLLTIVEEEKNASENGSSDTQQQQQMDISLDAINLTNLQSRALKRLRRSFTHNGELVIPQSIPLKLLSRGAPPPSPSHHPLATANNVSEQALSRQQQLLVSPSDSRKNAPVNLDIAVNKLLSPIQQPQISGSTSGCVSGRESPKSPRATFSLSADPIQNLDMALHKLLPMQPCQPTCGGGAKLDALALGAIKAPPLIQQHDTGTVTESASPKMSRVDLVGAPHIEQHDAASVVSSYTEASEVGTLSSFLHQRDLPSVSGESLEDAIDSSLPTQPQQQDTICTSTATVVPFSPSDLPVKETPHLLLQDKHLCSTFTPSTDAASQINNICKPVAPLPPKTDYPILRRGSVFKAAITHPISCFPASLQQVTPSPLLPPPPPLPAPTHTISAKKLRTISFSRKNSQPLNTPPPPPAPPPPKTPSIISEELRRNSRFSISHIVPFLPEFERSSSESEDFTPSSRTSDLDSAKTPRMLMKQLWGTVRSIRLNLRFDDRSLEALFWRHHHVSSWGQTKIALFLLLGHSLVMVGMYAALDTNFSPPRLIIRYLLRLGIVSLMILRMRLLTMEKSQNRLMVNVFIFALIALDLTKLLLECQCFPDSPQVLPMDVADTFVLLTWICLFPLSRFNDVSGLCSALVLVSIAVKCAVYTDWFSMALYGLVAILAGYFTEIEARKKFFMKTQLLGEMNGLKEEEDQVYQLLRCCMPATVIKVLTDNEAVEDVTLASMRFYDSVAVLVTDVVGFTEWTSRVEPEMVVQMLHKLMSAIDELVDTYGAEKIKTVGDSYVAVVGLEGFGPKEVKDMTDLALGLRMTSASFIAPDGTHLHMRIGVAIGQAVACIVGRKKWFWDLWGEAVTCAEEMEHSGVPDQVHITPEVYRRLQETGLANSLVMVPEEGECMAEEVKGPGDGDGGMEWSERCYFIKGRKGQDTSATAA